MTKCHEFHVYTIWKPIYIEKHVVCCYNKYQKCNYYYVCAMFDTQISKSNASSCDICGSNPTTDSMWFDFG